MRLKLPCGSSPFSQDDLWFCSSLRLHGAWELMRIGSVHTWLQSTFPVPGSLGDMPLS